MEIEIIAPVATVGLSVCPSAYMHVCAWPILFIGQSSCTSLVGNVTEMCVIKGLQASVHWLVAMEKRKETTNRNYSLIPGTTTPTHTLKHTLRDTHKHINACAYTKTLSICVCLYSLLLHTTLSLSQKAEATVSDHVTTRVSPHFCVRLLVQAQSKCEIDFLYLEASRMSAVCETFFFCSTLLHYSNRIRWEKAWRATGARKGEMGGGDAVATVTRAAAVVIMRLLLHCVCVCVDTARVSSPSSLQTGGEDIPL